MQAKKKVSVYLCCSQTQISKTLTESKRKSEATVLPLVYPGDGRTKYDPYTGYLTDFAVWITHRDSMLELFDYGSFGKGTLSRSKPEFQGNMVPEPEQLDGDKNEVKGDRRRAREQSGFHRKSRVQTPNKKQKKEPKKQPQQSERDSDFLDSYQDTQRTNVAKRQRTESPTPRTQTKCRGWWPPFIVKEETEASISTKEESQPTLQDSVRLPILQEFLQLGLEESFFLLYKLRCLRILTPIAQESIQRQIERLKLVSSVLFAS